MTLLPILSLGCCWVGITALAQEAPAGYVTPAQSVQKRGSAPGMKVKLTSDSGKLKEYVIIFSEGDEAYSGLLDFAEKNNVTDGNFTAIGALSGCILAWFDMEKKMYRVNSINEQVEVATMVGDFALYKNRPVVHTHMVVGHRDGSASAGHVIEAVVSPTLEVFVTVNAVPLHKQFDPASHLTLIDP